MKTINAPLNPKQSQHRRRLAFALLLFPGAAGLAGCGSPPSVVPVMRVVEQALLDEAERIETYDADRDQLILDDARTRLRSGYLADLQTTETLDTIWEQSATEVYVAAREAIVYQEIDLAQQRETRQDNLRDAARAQGRAIEILQQQDRLLQQTVGLDLWRLEPQNTEIPR